MFRLFVSYCLFSLISLVFTLIRSILLMFSLISVDEVVVHPLTTSFSFSANSVTLCDTDGSFLFRTRPYFPQWAHQVRIIRIMEEYSGRVSAYFYTFAGLKYIERPG